MVQAKVRLGLLLAPGNLFGVTCDSQFVPASTVHQGWLLAALDLGAGQQKSPGTLMRSGSICLCLLTACPVQSQKEPLAVLLRAYTSQFKVSPSPHPCHLEENAPPKRDGVCGMGE